MQKAPKKQHEIIVIGTGTLAHTIVHHMVKGGAKPHHINDLSTVHFIGNNLLSTDGEKIGFKRVLILSPSTVKMPEIKGLEKTTYEVVGTSMKTSKGLHHVILGGGEAAVARAIDLLALKNKVSMLYDTELLQGFDISIQDVVRRYLKSIGLVEVDTHLPIAATTRGTKTLLLLKNKSQQQIACDVLNIEPIDRDYPDIGLENQGYNERSSRLDLQSDVMVLPENSILSLRQVTELGDLLIKGRGSMSDSTYAKKATIRDTQLVSFGYLEQDIMHTHLSYQKSIAKSSEKLSTFHGFIKVLTTMSGKVISVSAILPVGYDTTRLFLAVRSKIHVSTLLDMFEVGDVLQEELFEVSREIR